MEQGRVLRRGCIGREHVLGLRNYLALLSFFGTSAPARNTHMSAPSDLSTATVGQLLIPVSNLERATAYYRDILGIPFLFSAPPQMSFFQTGNVRLLVGVPEDGTAALRSSLIYFRVDNIQDVHNGLVSRGVTFTSAPHLVHRTATHELWLADFSDPDGNPLAVMSEVKIAA